MMARDFSDFDEMIGRLQAIESRHNFIEQLAPHGSHQGDRKRLSYDGAVRKDRGRHPRLWRQLCPCIESTRFRCCRPVLPPLAVAGTFTLYATPCMVEQISSGCLRRWFKSKKTTTHGKICVALLNIKPPRHQSVLRRLPFVQCRHLGGRSRRPSIGARRAR